MREYRICSNCVMDTTDSRITFDVDGLCDHCRTFRDDVLPNWHPDERGEAELIRIADKIRADGKNRGFDCILGMNGGFASSYKIGRASCRVRVLQYVEISVVAGSL